MTADIIEFPSVPADRQAAEEILRTVGRMVRRGQVRDLLVIAVGAPDESDPESFEWARWSTDGAAGTAMIGMIETVKSELLADCLPDSPLHDPEDDCA